MNDLHSDIKQNLENEIAEYKFFDELEDNIQNFKLKKIFSDDDNIYNFFEYVNDFKHRGLKTYFHSDSKEFRIAKNFGFNEFCLVELITEDSAQFVEILQNELKNLIKSIDEFDGDENYFVEQKNISQWSYAEELQSNLENFNLFINPKKYLEVTNGSFVIINYCDFEINSDLAIYYNIFSDNFGSEARINGVPTVIYDFDSEDLNELEDRLKNNLTNQLKNIRAEILN